MASSELNTTESDGRSADRASGANTLPQGVELPEGTSLSYEPLQLQDGALRGVIRKELLDSEWPQLLEDPAALFARDDAKPVKKSHRGDHAAAACAVAIERQSRRARKLSVRGII